jgi:hypothetical protein
MAAANPYAAPTARVADAGAEIAPPMWNPNAAASWSLLFTPAFGAFLHMLNWRALGDQEKAGAAKTWFIVSMGMLALYLLLAVLVPNFDMRFVGFGYLLAWYFAAARSQAQYVKDKFGNDYPRNGWGLPLLLGIGGIFAYIVIAVIIGLIIGVAAR